MRASLVPSSAANRVFLPLAKRSMRYCRRCIIEGSKVYVPSQRNCCKYKEEKRKKQAVNPIFFATKWFYLHVERLFPLFLANIKARFTAIFSPLTRARVSPYAFYFCLHPPQTHANLSFSGYRTTFLPTFVLHDISTREHIFLHLVCGGSGGNVEANELCLHNTSF